MLRLSDDVPVGPPFSVADAGPIGGPLALLLVFGVRAVALPTPCLTAGPAAHDEDGRDEQDQEDHPA